MSGIALGTTRRVETADFKHAFVFSDLPDSHSESSKETTHVFPLKIHDAFGGTVDNFRPEFKKFLVQKYSGKFTVADTLAYLYAILYCPTYRERFNEFLRDDYARIPFPRKRDSFAELARLGLLLQDLHLLKNVPALDIGRYEGHGPSYIDDVKYEGDSVRINVTRRFAAVPSDIWNFQIGGYSPLSKYLKDRRGRELTISEIDRVRDIARVAASTAAQMIEIDRAYRVAFG